jgi:hypothetical protein
MSMTWLLCDYGEVLALAPSAADRDPLESEAGTGGPGFWAGYWRHRPAYDRADIGNDRYCTQVLGRAPGAARRRRIAELDTATWSRPNQASLDAAASAAERGIRLALLSLEALRAAPQDSLPGPERLVHHLKKATVTSWSGTSPRRKAGPSTPVPRVPPSASPWTLTRKHHEQTRAAISQLASPAAHGTAPEDADQ